AALGVLEAWVKEHDDAEAQQLLDERLAQLVSGWFEARIDGVSHVVVGTFPAVFGREGQVVVRGASVSREHCAVEPREGAFVVRDAGSRNGTQLEGMSIAGEVALAEGQRVSLGADLTLRVLRTDGEGLVMEIERGMDRGRRVVL